MSELKTNENMMSRREFLKSAAGMAAGAAAIGISGLAYAREIEPGWLDVTRHTIVLPRLAPVFAGYQIAHLSDIHMDDWMTPARLAEIVELTNRQGADVVAITGDFVTRHARFFADGLSTQLRQLSARDGVVAVLGNHDHWSSASQVRQVLTAAGIYELRNSVYTVQRNGAQLHLAGVDDVWENQDRLDLVLAALPAEGAAILLAHEPDFADASAATGRFDLQLSGHSHGGQVVLPLAGPPILPRLGRKYPLGRYQVGDMVQYTSRGLGMIQPQVRFNCRPEIAIHTLQPA